MYKNNLKVTVNIYLFLFEHKKIVLFSLIYKSKNNKTKNTDLNFMEKKSNKN